MEAQSPRRSVLGKVAVYLVGTLVIVAAALGVFMLAYPKRIAAATSVDGLDLSLLSKEEAQERLTAWWEGRADERIFLEGPSAAAKPVPTTPNELGIALDAKATLEQLPLDDFASWMRRTSSRDDRAERAYHIVLDFSHLDVARLEKVIAETSPDLAPAKALLDDQGKVVLTPEVSSMKLVRGETEKALQAAIVGRGACKLAAVYGTKDVPDEELAKITEVVSTFKTNFNAGDRSRSLNLRLAAEKLDGVVLLPGEKFSFNEYVGERTPANGFSKAGVYRRGRHEIDWGGGVCQVSTTLFNAAALANLKIERRHNHTFAVPYVPLGRDAAVSYGTADLAFVNSLDTPIAIDSKYERGRLTFSILGVKDPGLEVKLVPVVTEAWSHDTVYIEDPNLAEGQEIEVEKGGKGYRAITTKVVLRDGKEVSRETLFRSYYKGAPKIIARGTKGNKPKNETTVPIINPGLGPG